MAPMATPLSPPWRSAAAAHRTRRTRRKRVPRGGRIRLEADAVASLSKNSVDLGPRKSGERGSRPPPPPNNTEKTELQRRPARSAAASSSSSGSTSTSSRASARTVEGAARVRAMRWRDAEVETLQQLWKLAAQKDDEKEERARQQLWRRQSLELRAAVKAGAKQERARRRRRKFASRRCPTIWSSARTARASSRRGRRSATSPRARTSATSRRRCSAAPARPPANAVAAPPARAAAVDAGTHAVDANRRLVAGAAQRESARVGRHAELWPCASRVDARGAGYVSPYRQPPRAATARAAAPSPAHRPRTEATPGRTRLPSPRRAAPSPAARRPAPAPARRTVVPKRAPPPPRAVAGAAGAAAGHPGPRRRRRPHATHAAASARRDRPVGGRRRGGTAAPSLLLQACRAPAAARRAAGGDPPAPASPRQTQISLEDDAARFASPKPFHGARVAAAKENSHPMERARAPAFLARPLRRAAAAPPPARQSRRRQRVPPKSRRRRRPTRRRFSGKSTRFRASGGSGSRLSRGATLRCCGACGTCGAEDLESVMCGSAVYTEWIPLLTAT